MKNKTHDLEALRREVEELRAKVARYEARLEIDHHFVMPEGAETADDLVRVEVPLEEREQQIDGIECRDETIKLQDEALRAAEAENAALKAREREAYEECAQIAENLSNSEHIAFDMREGNFPEQSDVRVAIADALRRAALQNKDRPDAD